MVEDELPSEPVLRERRERRGESHLYQHTRCVEEKHSTQHTHSAHSKHTEHTHSARTLRSGKVIRPNAYWCGRNMFERW